MCSLFQSRSSAVHGSEKQSASSSANAHGIGFSTNVHEHGGVQAEVEGGLSEKLVAARALSALLLLLLSSSLLLWVVLQQHKAARSKNKSSKRKEAGWWWWW